MVNCHAGYMIRRVTRITITRKGCKPDIIVSGQYSVISQQINMSTNQQINNLTIQQLTASARCIRAEGLNQIHSYWFYCGIWVERQIEYYDKVRSYKSGKREYLLCYLMCAIHYFISRGMYRCKVFVCL